MSRESSNEYDKDGCLMTGYDYDNQAWVIEGKFIRCGHPDSVDCRCYGRLHEGEETRVIPKTFICDDCHRELPIDGFAGEDGNQAYCGDCAAKRFYRRGTASVCDPDYY